MEDTLSPNNSRRIVAIASLLGGLVIATLVWVLLSGENRPPPSDGELGGDFTLQSAEGNVSLSDLRGKVVILYFGFLSCPEVCPTSLGIIRNSLNRLSPAQQEQVQALLVSIDPARDSLEALEKFSSHFHPRITGVTGSETKLSRLAQEYGVYFKKVPSKNGYFFDHTSRYFVINKKGTLVAAMRHSTTPSELSAKIKSLL